MSEIQVNEVDTRILLRRQGVETESVLRGFRDDQDTAPHTPMVLILPMGLGVLLLLLSLPVAASLLPFALPVAVVAAFVSFVIGELRGLSRAFALLGSTTAATWAFGIAIWSLATGHLWGYHS